MESPCPNIGTERLDEFGRHTTCYYFGIKNCEVELTVCYFIVTKSQDVGWLFQAPFGYNVDDTVPHGASNIPLKKNLNI